MSKKMLYIGAAPVRCARCSEEIKKGECVEVPYYVTVFIDAREFVYGSNAAMGDVCHADCSNKVGKE